MRTFADQVERTVMVGDGGGAYTIGERDWPRARWQLVVFLAHRRCPRTRPIAVRPSSSSTSWRIRFSLIAPLHAPGRSRRALLLGRRPGAVPPVWLRRSYPCLSPPSPLR